MTNEELEAKVRVLEAALKAKEGFADFTDVVAANKEIADLEAALAAKTEECAGKAETIEQRLHEIAGLRNDRVRLENTDAVIVAAGVGYRERIQKLEEALKVYGGHQQLCHPGNDMLHSCDCGWTQTKRQLLAPAPSASQEVIE